MKTLILPISLLSLLLTSPVVFAQDVTAACKGVLIVTIGQDGPDQIAAVNAEFTMKMSGTRATFTLANQFAPAIKGTGVESGDDTRPWKLEAKDADGLVFKGGLTPVKAGYPGDTTLYMLVELKSSKVFISGPMSCLMK